MGKTVTIRIAFIRTAVLVASAVVAFLASNSCNGSCGEYVYSRYRTPTHLVPDVRQYVTQNDHDIRKSGLMGSAEEYGVWHDPSPVLPAPCSGPDCRRNPTPSLPVAPPTTIGVGPQDRLICGQSAVKPPSEVSRRRDLHGHVCALRGFPLLIEMPPEFVG